MNLISIVFGAILAAQLATAQKPSYGAGVVEFQTRLVNDSNINLGKETLLNAGRVVNSINAPDAKGLSVLVFPEGVLNYPETAVPVPKPGDNVVACGNKSNSDLIQTLSCAAKSANTYVTVHLYMSVNCTEDRSQWNDNRPCTNPKNDVNTYSAAVVFDRAGAVVAVYRKFNLNIEENVRKPLYPDNTTFTTDFDVEFGVFIGSDIMFDLPANQLVRNGVRNFVSPTLWLSELPYLTALQTQQMWSHRHNVNLLAAGGNLPNHGYSGSGIFSGKAGALDSVISDKSLTKLVFADVPNKPFQSFSNAVRRRVQNIVVNLPSDVSVKHILPGLSVLNENLENFTIRFLNFTRKEEMQNIQGEICIEKDNFVCCDYDIAVTVTPVDSSNVYHYAIAVFNGHRVYSHRSQKFYSRQMICSVVACREYGKPETCGLRLFGTDMQQSIRFERLNLQAAFTTGATAANATFAMANTLDRQIRPINTADFRFDENIYELPNLLPTQIVNLELIRPTFDIQTFAIYARNSLQDYVESGSKTIAVNGLLLLALSAYIMFHNQ